MFSKVFSLNLPLSLFCQEHAKNMTVKAEWEQLIRNLIAEDILKSPNVIRAMRMVTREQFLPESLRPHYYADAPLPIGW